MPIIKQADLTALTKGIADLSARLDVLEPTGSTADLDAAAGDDASENVTDPQLVQAFKTQDKLVAQMANPVIKVYSGRYGSNRVNQTLESLVEIKKHIRDIRAGKSSFKF